MASYLLELQLPAGWKCLTLSLSIPSLAATYLIITFDLL